MGKLKNGVFGHLTGRVGNLVCYTLKGKNIARAVGEITKPPSRKKLANYQQMEVINTFQKTILPFLNTGFAKAGLDNGQNPYNEAMSYNKKNALKGAYPAIEMDYAKALVSKGDLPVAQGAAIALYPNGVEFTWEMPDDLEYRYHGDRALLLLYFPSGVDASGRPYAVWELSGARRKDRFDFIGMDPNELASPFQAYIAFISDDRLQVSSSVWVAPGVLV